MVDEMFRANREFVKRVEIEEQVPLATSITDTATQKSYSSINHFKGVMGMWNMHDVNVLVDGSGMGADGPNLGGDRRLAILLFKWS